jgi:hypothetical protein
MTAVTRPALIAIGLVLGTTLCFAALDAVGKSLTADMHPIQVVWGRYAFHLLVLAALGRCVRARARPTRRRGRA